MIARSQSEHTKINSRHYPGTRQICCICDEPTERCEEDGIWMEQLDGWICPECDDHWTHFWGFHKWLGDYYGQPCRLIATSRINTALIEFPDGKKHVTIRYGLRKLSWTPKK